MPEHEQTRGLRWRLITPRKIFRWLLRFLGWSALASAAALLIALVIATALYANRARIVNETLAVFVEPLRVSVDEIELLDFGEIRIEGLRLSPRTRGGQEDLLEIPEARITYDFHELRQNRTVRTIELQGPVIRIGNEEISGTGLSPGETAASLSLADFAIFTESLSVENGRWEIDVAGAPSVSGAWQLDTDPLRFDSEGVPENPITLQLTDLVIGPDAKHGRIDQATAVVEVHRDLSRLVVDSLEISGIDTEVTPEWFAKGEGSESEGPDAPASSASVESPELDVLFRRIHIGRSSVAASGFDGREGLPSFPDLAFDTEITFEDVSFTDGRWKSSRPLTVVFSEVGIGPAEAQLASVDQIEVALTSPGELIHERTVDRIRLDGLDVFVSDKTLERLRNAAPPSATPEEKDELPWKLRHLDIGNATFLLSDATFDGSPAPRFETALSAVLSDLEVGGEKGFQSNALQEISLTRTSLHAPGVGASTGPLVSLESAEIGIRWSDFNFDRRVERVKIENPEILFTDEALGAWLSPALDESEPRPINRTVYKVDNLDVSGGTLEADSQFAEGRVPKIVSTFSITTDKAEDAEPFSYRISLENFELRNHAVSIQPEGPPAPSELSPDRPLPTAATPVAEEQVLKIRQISVSATAEQIQRTRRIEEVVIDGAFLRVGEGLRSVVEAGEKADDEEPPTETPDEPPPSPERPEPRQAAAGELPTWLLETVRITRSEVLFESLIPQVEGLEFEVETVLSDVPLSPDELLASDKLQKVELAGIEIKDPYDSFITVAQLPTIFVQFSLAGLARQEVERIDLIGPSLYVGQGLFWWIDYQRNFRAQNEGATVALEGGPVDEGIAGKPDWVIKTIDAAAGKIVIAPTGVPIGVVPFPFNATTTMEGGKTELKLNIPDEDYVYRFPAYKVDLYGLTGDVQFNVPVEDVNNNLVQTFALDRIVWKKYEAENLYLTVTFDEYGIYGSLGGDAYSGYVEAGFNFYLDDEGKWDAWVSGTGMDSGPITQALAPENFLMEGPISLKVVSEGRKKKFGLTTGEFQSEAPGWFDIRKFDSIREKFPSDWTGLQSSLAEIGLVAVKRFDYERGSGSLSLEGRDGIFDLRFTGPYGSRELTFHLHDERNTNTALANAGAPPTPDANPPVDPAPAPEASARPLP